MRHAVRHAMRVIDLDEAKRLYLGADDTGRILEVVLVLGDDPRIIHAMPLRRSYYRYLR